MDTRFAIAEYHDSAAINKELDELIAKPIYTIKPDVLKKYEEEYYEKKCEKTKELDYFYPTSVLSASRRSYGSRFEPEGCP